MSAILPPANEVVISPTDRQIEILGHLFEPCETLSSLIISKVFSKRTAYTTYRELIEDVRTFLLNYLNDSIQEAVLHKKEIRPQISKIIAAHPRLGAAKSNPNLSQHSSKEQRSLQQGSKEEAELLEHLNHTYETTFPGLRYVVFVNGRSRTVIMENMKERIERNDINLEREEAFNAMCDIALDRAQNLGAKL